MSRRQVVKACALLLASAPLARLTLANEGYFPAVPGGKPPPPSPFGFASTAEAVTAGLDLTGKTAFVTGCNSGLGLETMRVLALRGAHVIGAARTLEKAQKACAGVEGRTTPVAVELTDFDTIVAAAAEVRRTTDAIDMLILNAGIMALPELETVNGVERQFAVNHLGHFLLTEHLLPVVTAAPAGRVVVVSSGAHRWAGEEGLDLDNLDGSKGYDPLVAYGMSKVANGLFSRELARRLRTRPRTRCTRASSRPTWAGTGRRATRPNDATSTTRRSQRAQPRAATSRPIRGSKASRASTSTTATWRSRCRRCRTTRKRDGCGRSPRI